MSETNADPTRTSGGAVPEQPAAYQDLEARAETLTRHEPLIDKQGNPVPPPRDNGTAGPNGVTWNAGKTQVKPE